MNICGCASLHANYTPVRVSSPTSERTDSSSTMTPPKDEPTTREPASVAKSTTSAKALSVEELEMVRDLRLRDREVRAHEQAHLAAAGGLATGGASFSYQTGPDGKRYAVGGEVQVSTTLSSSDPQANLQKAMQLQRAALAPADPSPQDRAVAMNAAAMAQKARADLVEKAQEAKALEQNAQNEANAATKTNPTDEPSSELSVGNAQDAVPKDDLQAREQERLAKVKRAVAMACSMCGAEDHNDGIHSAANERKLQSAMRVHDDDRVGSFSAAA